MPLISKSFDSYQFNYVSDSGFTGNVNACEINLYEANVFVARICFIKPSVSLPTNAVNDNVPYLYYPLSQFGDIIGILRYDQAVGLYLDTDTHVGAISSDVEKIGSLVKKKK